MTDYPYTKMRFLYHIIHNYKFQMYKKTNRVKRNVENCRR